MAENKKETDATISRIDKKVDRSDVKHSRTLQIIDEAQQA